jgi:GNAT superfamily N-acetyltransferase
VSERPPIRQAGAADLPVVREIVTAAYDKYDSLLVENLAVRPEAQGTGAGRALMDFAERRARQLELTRLTLYTHVVMTENQAIDTHLGYREVERRTADGYHRVYMEKPLQLGATRRPGPPRGRTGGND